MTPVVRIAFNRPDCAPTPFGPKPSTLFTARSTARLDPSVNRHPHGQRPVPQGRRVGFLLWRRPAHCADTDRYRYEGFANGRAGSDAEISSNGRAPSERPSGERPSSGRLHILEVQGLIRNMPGVVIAAVSGWAAGSRHSLHVVCDLSVASLEHRPLQADGRERRVVRRRLRLAAARPPGG